MIFRLLLTALFAFCSISLFAQDAAQPQLPTATLSIGAHTITAEIADDDTERSTGLMFRESLQTDCGMLFVMPHVAPVAFYMKNTRIPLSIAFLDRQGVIVEIHDMEPFSEKIVPSAFPHIAYALEMSQGWFTKQNIWPGERITNLPAPPKE